MSTTRTVNPESVAICAFHRKPGEYFYPDSADRPGSQALPDMPATAESDISSEQHDLTKESVTQGGFFPAGVNGTLNLSSAYA